jgi:hypothetical protein
LLRRAFGKLWIAAESSFGYQAASSMNALSRYGDRARCDIMMPPMTWSGTARCGDDAEHSRSVRRAS